MLPIRIILFCLLFFVLLSCGKDKEEPTPLYNCPVKCFNAPIRVVFQGYSAKDLDTVFVKHAMISDTSLVTFTFPDTVRYFENGTYVGYGFENLELYSSTIIEIIIPSTGEVYKLSGLIKPDVTHPSICGKPYTCTVPIKEVSVSGGKYSIINYGEYPYYLQLKK